MIDWTFRIGDVAVVASLAGSCIFYAYRSGRFAEGISNMQKEISSLKDIAKSIGDVLTMVAVQKTEIKNIQDDVKDLKHGRGFVQGPAGVDREY